MDPQELEIKSIVASDPKLVKKKSYQYSVIPLRLGATPQDEKVSLLFKDVVFKIYESDYNEEKTFSLGINLKKENQQIMHELEKHIQKLAMKKKQEVKKLNASFSNFNEESFKLIKFDKSQKPKIYGKLYLTNNKINSPFFKGKTNKDGRKIKFRTDPHELIGLPLKGSVVIELNQIFCGNIKSLTCVVKEALITEIIQPQSTFDQYDDVLEKNYESDDEFDL